MGAATIAFFSDEGTSSNNTFIAGTLDLKLSDATIETDEDNVTASFGDTLAPDDCTGDQLLTLKNTGTINADHAAITIVNNVTDANDNASPDMDSYLRIAKLEYDSVDKSSQITNSNGNGFLDLNDWASGTGLDDLSLTDLNTGHNLVMDVCFDDSAPNELQGDSVDSDWTITLNQDSSQ